MTQGYGSTRQGHVAKLRAQARRVRKHARALHDDPAAPRLEDFANELDKTAKAIEETPENPLCSSDSEHAG